MGQRFSRIIAANSIDKTKTSTTTTTRITIQQMSKQTEEEQPQQQQQQQETTIISTTLDFPPTATSHLTPKITEPEQQQHTLLVAPTNNGTIIPIIITTTTTPSAINSYKTFLVNSNSSNNSYITINKIPQQEDRVNVPFPLGDINYSNHYNNPSSCAVGRQIVIKIQLTKMESGNEMAIIDKDICRNRVCNNEFYNNQYDIIGSDISKTFEERTININAITAPIATQVMNSEFNVEVLPKNTTESDSISLKSEFDRMTISRDFTTTNLNAERRCTEGINSNDNQTITNEKNSSSNNVLYTAYENYNNELMVQNHLDNPQKVLTEEFLLSNSSKSVSSNLQSTTSMIEGVIEPNFCCTKRKWKCMMTKVAQVNDKDNRMTLKVPTTRIANRRCCKCSCRDVFWRILDPTSSRLTRHQQQQKLNNASKGKLEPKHSKHYSNCERSLDSRTLLENNNKTAQLKSGTLIVNCFATHSSVAITSTTTGLDNQFRPTMANISSTVATVDDSTTREILTSPDQMLVQGAPNANDVNAALENTENNNALIKPTIMPQFVIVQCAIVNVTDTTTIQLPQPPEFVAAATIFADVTTRPNSLISNSMAPTFVNNTLTINSPNSSNNVTSELIETTMSATSKIGKAVVIENSRSSTPIPVVHSQVDFQHFLVPDLENITNASFYWGKMDRYEAERLLDDKSEGTFLLRDSAQEEFLFSVSFRKYGRSLHARIEQSSHRFSFDCHDPGVYTAPTVMGLLEHYKDPACVMFFEPILTTPLNREFCFSLQQLCRATIVSNISSYDSITELELPASIKLYLKEYHYKQKLRVKSFDELLYESSRI